MKHLIQIILFITLASIFKPTTLQGQVQTIQGTILDDDTNEPVPFCNVIIKLP